MAKIRLKNLPEEGRLIKDELQKNGDVVEMIKSQAEAYINADVGDLVKKAPKEEEK